MLTYPELQTSLIKARTYGDVYDLPFQLQMGPLRQPDLFAALNSAPCSTGIENRNRSLKFNFNPPAQALSEFISIAREFERQRSFFAPQEWSVISRRESGDRCSIETHTNILHPDAIHDPRIRIIFACSADPTLVVSHAETADISNRHAPEILDLRIGEENAGAFMRAIEKIRPLLNEAAQPVPANTVCVVTGATFHKRPAQTCDTRVFARARVNNLD